MHIGGIYADGPCAAAGPGRAPLAPKVGGEPDGKRGGLLPAQVSGPREGAVSTLGVTRTYTQCKFIYAQCNFELHPV